ncbi:hypothetical protein ACJJTC_016671 [Scirpophaga incertulas]
MASSEFTCSGCLQTLSTSLFLRCSICTESYDLLCAGLSKQQFLKTKTEQRLKWKCETCKSKQPRGDNSDTPVRCRDDKVMTKRGASVPSPSDKQPQVTSGDGDIYSLTAELRMCREEMENTRNQMRNLNDSLSGLISRMTVCENKVTQIEARIEKLEQRENDCDGDLLLNDIEITCIPEQRGERLQHMIMNLGQKLGVQLEQNDVVSVSRVGRVPYHDDSKGDVVRPRPIVVRLVRRAMREEFLQAARVRRGLTTEGMDLMNPPCRFYINERLTRTNRILFRRARDIGSRLNWRYVWTRDGKIFVRQRSGQEVPRYRLRTEADLVRVFGQDAVGDPSKL